MNKEKKILITGVAGFIGFHIAQKIQFKGYKILGIDNLNNYYSRKLKLDRLKVLNRHGEKKFIFKKIDLKNKNLVNKLFSKNRFDYVVHLAAQAGVRHSLKKPLDYVYNNVLAFTNLLECCKRYNIKHLLYASTSSVYGNNLLVPFKENHSANHPIQFYAATKRSNELMAHSYSHIYKLPTTGLRFFTVYGPWGRPDMALFKFTKNILKKKEIELYNFGNHKRDFTYVEDVADIVSKLIKKPPKFLTKRPKKINFSPNKSNAPFRILNIGQSNQTTLLEYVNEIEKNLGLKAKKKLLPLQTGDIFETKSNIQELKKIIKIKKFVPIKKGISLFINWYKKYYNL